MTPDDDARTRWLIEQMGVPEGSQDACPDDGLLTGFAEGALPTEYADQVERHLAGCATCRALLVGWSDADTPEVDRRAAAPRAWVPLAAAALLLVGIGVALALLDGESADTRTLLAQTVEDLAHVDGFQDFALLDTTRDPQVAVVRGGLRTCRTATTAGPPCGRGAPGRGRNLSLEGPGHEPGGPAPGAQDGAGRWPG